MIEIVRKAIALLNTGLRRRWGLLTLWSVASALLEMLATAGVLVLIRMVAEPGVSMPRIARLARLDQIPSSYFAVGLAGLFLVKNLVRFAETRSQQRCATRTAVWLSSGLLSRYLNAPYAFHLHRNSSELISNVQRAVDDICWVILQPAIGLLSESTVAAAVIVVLVGSAPAAALITLLPMGAAVAAMLIWMQHRHIALGKQEHRRRIGQLQDLRQGFAAIKEVKVLGREAGFVARASILRENLGELEASRQTLEVVPRLVVETGFIAALAMLIVIVHAQNGGATRVVPFLGVFAYAGLRLLPSVHLIAYRSNRIGAGAAALDAVSRDWYQLAPTLRAPETRAAIPQGAIAFDDVSFQYEDAAKPALENITISIEPGESIGVVGPTGSGKSTFVDLITGLLEPTSGRITIGERDLRTCVQPWQSRIGYVPQNVYLTDDSISHNIALGLTDAEIDEERVREAVNAAQLSDFTAALPDGLNTAAGERGVRLSGGERQRIAVARALYRRPAVLVFDEATSALDADTERCLTAAIQSLRGTVTVILIAHRLSTVRECDRVLFLRDGRLCSSGTYDELLDRDLEFRKLAFAAPLKVPEMRG